MRRSHVRDGRRPGVGRERLAPALLWVTALAVATGATVWQWHTAPLRPREGEVDIGGLTVPYRLVRSGTSGEPVRVTVAAAPGVSGTLRWRRYPTDEAFQGLTMLRDGSLLVGLLPSQPPGGRLEYSLVLAGPFGLARIPDTEAVVMRFEGSVPRIARMCYVAILFASLLVGVRAGLAALLGRAGVRRLTRVAFGGFTAGGVVLGTLVRLYAFDTVWAGWPLGHDPAGQATLVMWVSWAVAVAALGWGQRPADRFGRTVVVLATAVTVVVSLIPHSLRA